MFVDDAVRGRLPLVCAKTGEPADLVIRMRQPVGGGLGAAWLLVVFGPIGWLLLVLASLVGPRPEYLTVRIPQSSAAYSRERWLGGFRLAAIGLGFGAAAYGMVRPGPFPLVWLALAGAFFLAGLALHVAVYFQSVGVGIDVSRRWVTLSGVHPAFVRAVEARERLATAADR